MKQQIKFNRKNAFTLVEVLIVIAILAVLGTVVVFVINPAELLKEMRDGRRITDLNQIDLDLATLTAAVPRTDLGSANTVYVSLPDSTSTCANLGLPGLPTGWSYRCATSANYRKTDGSGWIPADFTKYPAGTLVSVLPVDPSNTVDGNRYYTYVTGGSWALASVMESNKHLVEKAREIGEFDPERLVIGNDTDLWRDAYGIVGYWKLDDNIGTSAVDASGKGHTATLQSGPTWQTGASCQIGNCLSFDGTNDYVNVPDAASLDLGGGSFSIAAWVRPALVNSAFHWVIDKGNSNATVDYLLGISSANKFRFITRALANDISGTTTPTINTWYYLSAVQDASANVVRLYVNGIEEASSTLAGSTTENSYEVRIGARGSNGSSVEFFNGRIDEVRLWDRALSADEILTIYNATN